MATAIEFNDVSKQYRLGLVSTKTLSHDLDRWWKVNVLHKEDPYLKIGSVNDRASAADSEYVWALKNIDFKVEQGDVVGIIGKNGAGKSTLLKLLSKITAPTTGTINARGRIGALLEVGTGFHQEMTGRENIYLNGAIMGMSKQEISRKLDEIVAFSGCERYIDTPVKRYSSGMTVRLGFAVAAHLEPEILVVDEVLAVGDAEFQKKAIGKMQEVSKGEGRTVLFVSHNMTAVKNLCYKGILLENGQLAMSGPIDSVINEYLVGNAKNQTSSLSDRKDRIGDGSLRVEKITFRNAEGEEVHEAFCGQELTIDFDLSMNGKVDLSKLMFACNLSDAYGTPVVLWSSDEMQHSFINLQDRIRLVIPNINLRPSKYLLNYQISVGSTSPKDFCDSLNNADQITILGDHFYCEERLITRQGYNSMIYAYLSD